jgi:uncharacterized YccA/Bax inhibitor family protein
MALFKSGNPALNKDTFAHLNAATSSAEVMTINGTVNKVAFLLGLTMLSAYVTWNMFFDQENFETVKMFVFGGSIIGLVLAFFISYNKDLAGYLVPLYAVAQGLTLGGLSAFMESFYPGIVIQSLSLTFSIFIMLLVIYKLRLIKVTENFKLIVASATSGIALYYLLSFVLSFFSIELPLIHQSTTAGIIFSVFVVIVAAINLVVDFDFIEQGAENKVPKYMEWYGAFGLLVTLIWLYIEILRLLAKARRK